MIRMAIIGCGKIVEETHTPALLKLKDRANVVAIADAVPARLKVVGDMLDVPNKSRYTDYAELLSTEEVQIVDVALPHFLYEKVSVDCARAKVDIISEKPFATTLQAAEKILDATRENNVRLGVVHNYLYRPEFSKTLELIRNGAIGRPFLFRYEQFTPRRFHLGTAEYDPAWRTTASRGGAGCLIDAGYHSIYLARAILGSPVVRVFARANTYLHKMDVEDTALVLMEHENGSSSNIQNGWTVNRPLLWLFEVHGTEGHIALDAEENRLGLYRYATEKWEHTDMGNDARLGSFLLIFKDFLDAYEKGSDFPISGEDAKKNLEIIMAAYRSAKTGESVTIT